MFLNAYAGKFRKKEEKMQVTTVNSYAYWTDTLFEKCLRIFEWDGLPFPQKEIEMRLIMDGFCGFVKDGIKGLMVASGGMSGPTQYFDEFEQFTYAAATAQGGTKKIGKDCVIIDNTALRNSLYPMIARYASLISHAEVSLKAALVNMRALDIFSSEDEGTADSVNAFYNKLYDGELKAIVDESLVGSLNNIANSRSGDIGVKDALDARNEMLRAFFNEIGVRYTRDKKERMVADEVNNDDQMLLININDMLKQRQKASEEINALFGLKTSVRLSDEFQPLVIEDEKEEPDNEG